MNNVEMIMKPTSVARVEFIDSLTDLINNSMLPPFIIEPILKDMYNDVRVVAQKQYLAEKEQYENEVKQKQNK